MTWEVRLVGVVFGVLIWGPWTAHVAGRRGHSFWFGYPFGLVLGPIGVLIVRFLPHGSRQSEQSDPPAPAYDAAGWDRLAATAGTLPVDRQEWMRTELAKRQERGQLMAAVIGRRARDADDREEPAALLIYPHVIVAASGQAASYLRPGGRHVVDASVGQAGLEEVTALQVHIAELGPPGQQSAAIEALRSLPWIEVREMHPYAGM
jgi:hypothetical protein